MNIVKVPGTITVLLKKCQSKTPTQLLFFFRYHKIQTNTYILPFLHQTQTTKQYLSNMNSEHAHFPQHSIIDAVILFV